jgi:hypothetical protein
MINGGPPSIKSKYISGILAPEGKALCKCFHKESVVGLKASLFLFFCLIIVDGRLLFIRL